jgi:hypothetical protein
MKIHLLPHRQAWSLNKEEGTWEKAYLAKRTDQQGPAFCVNDNWCSTWHVNRLGLDSRSAVAPLEEE